MNFYRCPPGYNLDSDGYKCMDIDECEVSKCQHGCINTLGSYYCTCKTGYKPHPE